MRFSRALGLSAVLLLGCCPPIKPTPEEVRALVASELPVGSSDADVTRFFEAHGFGLDKPPTDKYMQGSRRVGGCESRKPVVIMLVTFDGSRVESVDVRGAAMGP